MSASGWEIGLGSALGALSASVPVSVQAWLARRERLRERKFELKKQVFLDGASGLERIVDTIASLAYSQSGNQEQIKSAPDQDGWTVRLMMSIEQNSTGRSVAAAFICGNEAIARLSWKRAEIAALDARLATNRQQIAYLRGLLHVDDQKQSQTQETANRLVEEWRQCLELDKRLTDKRIRDVTALFQKALDWRGKYRGLLAAAIVEMRKELDFEPAAAWLPAVVREVQEKDREIMSSLSSAGKEGEGDGQ
jgi:hypothetical protein